MRKLIIILSLIGLALSSPVIVKTVSSLGMTKSEKLEHLIENRYLQSVSDIMSQEIIKQLKEKEGMGFEDYLIIEYYRRMLEK